GELLVKFKTKMTKNLGLDIGKMGMKVDRVIRLSYGDVQVVKLDNPKSSVFSAAKALASRDDVVYAEPNYVWKMVNPVKENNIASIFGSTSDTRDYDLNDQKFSSLWGMKNTGSNDPGGSAGVEGVDIDALRAWDITTGSRNIKIAVIDTGIDYTHPDLKDNMWVNEAEKNGTEGVDDDNNGYVDDIYGYDFANNDGDPRDGHGHGTHCAGTIGATHNNEIGVAGVMNRLQLVALKFLTDSGSGSSEAAIKSIDYATKLGVDVMSNSWGGGTFSNALEDAIKRASDAGIIFVAAAGNSGTDNDSKPHYPSNYEVENVIAVASHTSEEILSNFSCFGKTSVDIAAPGSNIMSTVSGGGYKSYSGTSMATPHVSGSLGLLVSHIGRLSHVQMRERLLATSEYSPSYVGKTASSGRLNLYNLLVDFRPERPWEPGEDDWKSVVLDEVFESKHPYLDNTVSKRTITVPGAKLIRVRVKKFELENRFDYILVKDKNDTLIEKVSGLGEDYATDYIEGDTVKLEFRSDKSYTKWGFVIEKVEAIFEIPEN
ncbi:MAG: S8 family serine peptidase, partial [Bacteriovoracaceae bacterium]|nr:S8 family serine peptidase [Bacteriovoracaceae bacterium]